MTLITYARSQSQSVFAVGGFIRYLETQEGSSEGGVMNK